MFKEHRERLAELIVDGSMLLLYSGIALHVSQDEYYPFRENRNFFWLTGLRREGMLLSMTKREGKVTSTLYIEEPDPHNIRWTGKMVTADEARVISGIEDVRYTDRIEGDISAYMAYDSTEVVYFDCQRHSTSDLPDYNLVKAEEFSKKYPHVRTMNLHTPTAKLRRSKDAAEVERIKAAIELTKHGLERVMSTLHPDMHEYEAQAEFEYEIFRRGAEGPSFPTIAGAGTNGCMLHYGTNRELCRDGDLLLLDLGAKLDGYCADITRTYPINGHFSERQRQYYDIVLRANRTVAERARAGMTTRELNDICKEVLADGLIEMGKISDASEISKYYMHGVSHHLGIDVHDADVTEGRELTVGAVISDEPGLYIDEEGIGIRIEDDLLITEDGAVVLSEDVIRDPDEIERFMAEHHN